MMVEKLKIYRLFLSEMMFIFMLWVFLSNIICLYEFPFLHFLQLNSFVISIDGRCAWCLVWPASRFVCVKDPAIREQV